MKLQIDTSVKTITIDQAIAAGELFELLNSMFPNFAWKDYLIIPEKEIHFLKDPITIPWQPQPWFVPSMPGPSAPIYPTYPWITCGTDIRANNGPESSTYNVIINKI